jgi:hypothetical protein
VGHIDGVAICDMNISGHPDDGFLNLTHEAMELIKSVDPRRHRRVCRRLNYIVNMILISGGDYDHKGKICNVDYAAHFATAYPEWNVRRYACLLIHEATHGVISAKGILYDKERRQRIEKLCHREEYRFAMRLEPGWAEENIEPFDSERWKLYWEGSFQRKMGVLWNRIRESLKTDKSSQSGDF